MWLPIFLSGCDEQQSQGNDENREVENVDPEEQAQVAKLKPTVDPILREIQDFRVHVRGLYNHSNFDELERIAEEIRSSRACFRNGSWKLYQFYTSLECSEDEPKEMWELHGRIHEAWIAAKPESITARVAHADFYVSYAWIARGSGYADSVSPQEWKTFGIRIGKAYKILENAQQLKDKDPYFWDVTLRVGRAQGWEKEVFDSTVAQAVALEPKFFGVDVSRAITLLPRWFGEPGDWEAYAQKASERPNGLGAEVYTRIVMSLRGYHQHIFRDSKASWPRTKEGLQLMAERYPDSIEVTNLSARLATMADDREFAKAAFDKLGDNYLPSVWPKPTQFVHFRTWAQTGVW